MPHERSSLGRSQRGSVLVVVVVLLLVLLGFLAVAIDFGYAYVQRNRLQAVTDAAALSCASANARAVGACADGDTDQSNPVVLGAVDPDGFALVATVPQTCPNPYASSCVKVSGSITWDTFFLPLFNLPTLTANASSTAGSVGAPCLHGLRASGTNLRFSNRQTSVFDCWIASRATSTSSISVQAQATVSSTQGWTSAGTVAGTLTAPVQLPNRTPIPDPYIERTAPAVDACLQTNYTHNTCNPLPAGTYCGLVIAPNNCGTLPLSGTYVIRAGTKQRYPGLSFEGGQNATILGEAVTFYILDGRVETDAQRGNLLLTPPPTGDLRDLLFWQAATNANPLNLLGSSLADGRSLQFLGVTYAPGAVLTVQRGAEGTMTVKDLVAAEVSVLSAINVTPTDTEMAVRFRPNVVLLD